MTFARMAIACVCLAGSARMGAANVIQDTDWVPLGIYPGLEAVEIKAVASTTNGIVYVGGVFTNAGGLGVTNIVAWNGTNWSSLGGGLSSTGYSEVNALAVDGLGRLYAAGRFDRAGTRAVTNIARWDGVTWTNLGAGVPTYPGYPSTLHALAIDTGNIVHTAGDLMPDFDTSTIEHVWRWNGTTWSNLGTGVRESGASTFAIYALSITGAGPLYAGGSFTNIGGVAARAVARWSGSAWSAVGSGLSNVMYALAQDRTGSLYAGGSPSLGGWTTGGVAQWNGTSWNGMGTGIGTVRSLAVDSNNTVYAGESLRRWSPLTRTWTNVSGANSGGRGLTARLSGGVHSSVSLLNTTFTPGPTAGFMNTWDGSKWITFGEGLINTARDLQLGPGGSLYAVGEFKSAGAIGVNYIARWTGSMWTNLGLGLSSFGTSLAYDGAGSLYVGGNFTNAGGVTVNRIARWDGTNWHALGSGLIGGAVTEMISVSPTQLYVAGGFTNAGGVAARGVALWNGVSWSELGPGFDTNATRYGFAMAYGSNGVLYVGGEFTNVGSVAARNIAAWNGVTWTNLGSGIPTTSVGGIYALTLDALGRLLVSGTFVSAGGVPATNMAVWNGTSWTNFGNPNSPANDLFLDPVGNVYATGFFTQIGGVTANRIARWNGTEWTALGSGLDAAGYALAFDPAGRLYVGGSFRRAGNQPVAYAAAVNVPVSPDLAVRGTNGVDIANGDTTPATADGTDFGAALVATGRVTRVFPLANVGIQSLSISAVTLGGAHAADFSISFSPASLASGSATNLTVTFAPVAAGGRTSVISIASTDPDSNPFTFTVRGTGQLASEINLLGTNGAEVFTGDLTPSAADGTDFGGTDVATGWVERVFGIQNAGTDLLTISDVTFTGSHTSDFSVVSWPTTVLPGSTSNLVVRFDPTAVNLRTATLRVDNNDLDEPIYTVGLQGVGTGVDLVLRSIANPDSEARYLTVQHTVSNRGPDAASSVVLTSSIPPGASIVASSSSLGSWLVDTNGASLAVGSLASGAVVQASLTFSPAPGGFTSASTVVCTPPDFAPSDNLTVVDEPWGWYLKGQSEVVTSNRHTLADLAIDAQDMPHLVLDAATAFGNSCQLLLRIGTNWTPSPLPPPVNLEPFDTPIAVAFHPTSQNLLFTAYEFGGFAAPNPLMLWSAFPTPWTELTRIPGLEVALYPGPDGDLDVLGLTNGATCVTYAETYTDPLRLSLLTRQGGSNTIEVLAEGSGRLGRASMARNPNGGFAITYATGSTPSEFSSVVYRPSDGAGASFPASASSIAFDSAGSAHLMMYLTSPYRLAWVRQAGAAWITNVFEAVGYDSLKTVSMKLDSLDRPHAVYVDSFRNTLEYGQWVGDRWVRQTIGTVSNFLAKLELQLDSQDRPHLLYLPSGTGGQVVYWTGGVPSDVDVRLAMTSTPLALDVPYEYVVTVSNRGPGIARNVLVTDVFPSSLTVESIGADTGTTSRTATSVVWRIPTLTTSSVLRLQVRPTAGGFISNRVTAVTANSDDSPTNNSAFTIHYIPNPGTLAFGLSEILHQENNPLIQVPVVRAGGTEGTVLVEYVTSNGTATGGADFTAATNVIALADGQQQAVIVIGALDDADLEGEESFRVHLRGALNGAKIVSPSNVLIRVQDNDVPGVLTLGATNYSVSEAAGQVVVRLDRSLGAVGVVTVLCETVAGTAITPADFATVSSNVVFDAGVFSRSVAIPLAQDSTPEPVESFSVRIRNASGGATFGVATAAVVSIIDDDQTIQFGAAVQPVSEGAGSAVVVVTRFGDAAITSTVNYATANGTASAGSDFVATAGTLTFTNGQTTATFPVTIINDATFGEPDETVLLTLSAPSANASLGMQKTSQLLIQDNDRVTLAEDFERGQPAGWIVRANQTPAAKWRFDNPGKRANRTGAGGKFANADSDHAGTVRMDTELITPTLNFAGVNGVTLSFAYDFVTFSGRWWSAPSDSGIEFCNVDVSVNGQGGPWFNVWQIGDPVGVPGPATANLDVSHILAGVPNAAIRFHYRRAYYDYWWQVDAVRVAAVSSDPVGPGRFRIATSSYNVRENEGAIPVTIQRSGGLEGAVSVTLQAVSGTALAGSDYLHAPTSVTFPNLITSVTVPVPIVDDTAEENAESFSLQIVSPQGGATLSSPTAATVTILDDDGLVSDVGVSLSAGPSPWRMNDPVELRISVSNNGPQAASRVLVQQEFPPATLLVATSPSQGSVSNTAGGIEWNVGSLAPFAGATMVVTSRFPMLGEVTNRAWVSTDDADTIPANDAVVLVAAIRSPGRLQFSSGGYSMAENGGAVTIEVQRIEDSLGDVSVALSAQGLSATAGADFAATNGVLTFADGVVAATFRVEPLNDGLIEGQEYIRLLLSAPVGAALGASEAFVAIEDDDIQSLLLNQGFGSGSGPARLSGSATNWTVVTNAGPTGWRFDNPGSRTNQTGGSGGMAIADSAFAGNVLMDTELRSPAVNLANVGAAVLSFRSDLQSTQAFAEVAFSTNAAASWETLWSARSPSLPGPQVVAINLAGTALGSTNACFSFRYFNATNDGWWQVDDFRIYGEEDTDGDGLPDWWETLNFQGLGQTSAADYDEDGSPNGVEWEADASPTNQNSNPEIYGFTLTNGQPVLRFDGSPVRLYDIEGVPAPSTSAWTTLDTSIQGKGGSQTTTVTNADSNRFFRLRIRSF